MAKTTTAKRAEVAKKKKVLATKLLRQKKTNDQIQAVMHSRFGSGIDPNTLADIRAQLGISGPNRGLKRTISRGKKCDAVMISPTTLVQRSNGASPELHSHLNGLLTQMHFESIDAIAIKKEGNTGHVIWTQKHETMIDLGALS